MNDDATQPKRADVFPPDYENEPLDDDSSGAPGCLAWGIIGIFGVLMAVAIVVTSTLAGFNKGLDIAHVTASAESSQNMARQCDILPTDIAEGRFAVIESRFEALTVNGILADCAQVFVQQATIVYEQSLITLTVAPSETAIPTMTATQLPENTVETTSEVTIQATSDSPYDLDGLLLEARSFISQENYADAITTLDAIRAIDENFDAQTVNSLLFNSLTQRALRLFRTENGSLAEAILLTNRAEQFGNIQATDLPFERSVAELYLDAQANLGVNYSRAIQLLIQVTNLSPNYPRGTGLAATTLRQQYEANGDALLAGGDACLAETQFVNALSLSPNSVALQTKRDTANQQCIAGVPPTTDPNVTPDPNAPPPTATSGVAPIGQTGS